MKEMNWDLPSTKKHIKEASKVGLELIGKGNNTDRHYREYLFKKCGHIQDMQITHIRSGFFKCRVCYKQELEEDAESVGFKHISIISNTEHEYSCNKCNHHQTFQHSNVRKNEIKCENCWEETLINEAKKENLTVIEKSSRASRIYRFNACGHTQKIYIHTVRNRETRCNTCYNKKILSKLHKEAFIAGVKLLGEAQNKKSSYREYKILDCGHIQDIGTKEIRNHSFLCSICSDTSRTKPSKIYLIEFSHINFHWLKMGYSKKVETRIKQYQLRAGIKYKVLKKVDFKDAITAHEEESKMHKANKNKKLSKKKMSTYMKYGNTECYPIEMKEQLLEELASLESK